MTDILIKNVLLNGKKCDIAIKDGVFADISSEITIEADKIINANGKLAIFPPFYNTHTHQAMTLLRGYADDLELFDWLNNHIWPAEALLTKEDVYAGARLAILEMIKGGSVFFNDSYWYPEATAKAAVASAKAIAKATAAMVKAIIAGLKSLVATIAAGGWVTRNKE